MERGRRLSTVALLTSTVRQPGPMWAGGRARGFPCRDSPEGSATTFSIGEEVGRDRAADPPLFDSCAFSESLQGLPFRKGALSPIRSALNPAARCSSASASAAPESEYVRADRQPADVDAAYRPTRADAAPPSLRKRSGSGIGSSSSQNVSRKWFVARARIPDRACVCVSTAQSGESRD